MHSNIGRTRRAPVLRFKNQLTRRQWNAWKDVMNSDVLLIYPPPESVQILRLSRAGQLDITARIRTRRNLVARERAQRIRAYGLAIRRSYDEMLRMPLDSIAQALRLLQGYQTPDEQS